MVWPWPLLAEAPVQPGAPGKNVLFFTKSAEYEHDIVRRDDGRLGVAETTLSQLGKEHGMAVTASKDGTVFDRDIERYDAFVFYTTGDLTTAGEDQQPPMSPGGKAALLRAIKAGKGFVGIHCASDTFHSAGERYQPQAHRDPYIDMLGGEFISHGEQQPARLHVVDAGFPGMHLAGDGFVLFEEWYSLKNFAPDLHVILALETAGMHGPEYRRPPYPATWARRHGARRVFYTCLGHRADVWAQPLFQAMLIGGMAWVLGNVHADVSANLPQVTPGAYTLPPQ
jgi:type 1 glutamine amidotransferase